MESLALLWNLKSVSLFSAFVPHLKLPMPENRGVRLGDS